MIVKEKTNLKQKLILFGKFSLAWHDACRTKQMNENKSPNFNQMHTQLKTTFKSNGVAAFPLAVRARYTVWIPSKITPIKIHRAFGT